MQPTAKMIHLVLFACCAWCACNKSSDTPPPPGNVPPPPVTPPQDPPKEVCIPLSPASLQAGAPNGFWLDGVLQFEPQLVEMKDTAGYWVITGKTADDKLLYISFKQSPVKSWMYYRVHGHPIMSYHDSCAVSIAFRNGHGNLVSHPLYSPDYWDSDKVPVHVTEDSIYVSFDYNTGASSGGPPYKIAGRLKGKKTY